MSRATRDQFAQDVYDQRLLEQDALSPVNWPGTTSPYTQLFASATYTRLRDDGEPDRRHHSRCADSGEPGQLAVGSDVVPWSVHPGLEHRPGRRHQGRRPRRRCHPAPADPGGRGRAGGGGRLRAAAGAVRPPHDPRADQLPGGGADARGRAAAAGGAPTAKRRTSGHRRRGAAAGAAGQHQGGHRDRGGVLGGAADGRRGGRRRGRAPLRQQRRLPQPGQAQPVAAAAAARPARLDGTRHRRSRGARAALPSRSPDHPHAPGTPKA